MSSVRDIAVRMPPRCLATAALSGSVGEFDAPVGSCFAPAARQVKGILLRYAIDPRDLRLNSGTGPSASLPAADAAILLLLQVAAPRPSLEKHVLEAAVAGSRTVECSPLAAFRSSNWQLDLNRSLQRLESAGSIRRSATGFHLTGYGYMALRQVPSTSRDRAQIGKLINSAINHRADGLDELKALANLFDTMSSRPSRAEPVRRTEPSPRRGKRGLRDLFSKKRSGQH